MYGYLTKPIQKQEDKKATRSSVDFADKTGESSDKQDTEFSFSKIRTQNNPQESSQTKFHAYLQSLSDTPAFGGGSKPLNNAGAAGDTVQCWFIKESSHYNNGDHLGTKCFLDKIDSGLALSNKLYRKCRGKHNIKHVAFFKLRITLSDNRTVEGGSERIIIVFKWFSGRRGDDDVLLYDTAYYAPRPSPAEPGAVAWNPAEPLELTKKEYDVVRGLASISDLDS